MTPRCKESEKGVCSRGTLSTTRMEMELKRRCRGAQCVGVVASLKSFELLACVAIK
jgi:hypothetical protein